MVLFGSSLWFSGPGCRKPVRVTRRGLILDFLCILYGLLRLDCREPARVYDGSGTLETFTGKHVVDAIAS